MSPWSTPVGGLAAGLGQEVGGGAQIAAVRFGLDAALVDHMELFNAMVRLLMVIIDDNDDFNDDDDDDDDDDDKFDDMWW